MGLEDRYYCGGDYAYLYELMIGWIIFAVVAVVVLHYCKFGKSIGHAPDFRKPFSVVALIVYAIIMLVCCSCGSSKSNLRQASSVEEGLNHTRKDSSSVSKEVTKTESEESTEETEEMITEYDTSKPIDPVTGKPPIKSETKKNTRKESGKKVDTKENTQANASAKEQTSAKKKEDVVKVDGRQKDETTVPRQIGGLVWALIALVIVGWLVYKKIKQ